MGVNASSNYSSSSGVYLGGDSSGGGSGSRGVGGGRYGDLDGYGSGGNSSGGGYVVTSVSKVRSSSSGGGGTGSGRRLQSAGLAGGPSPSFRDRKNVTSRSGGYEGEEAWEPWDGCLVGVRPGTFWEGEGEREKDKHKHESNNTGGVSAGHRSAVRTSPSVGCFNFSFVF